ncbi:MAG: S9 family peptidase [Pseudomonadota bacterium]
MTETSTPKPPRAEAKPSHATWHGETLTDNYTWLRADNWQDVMRDPALLDADIRAYLEAENAYTASVLADTEALQETLFQEMKGRIKEDDSSVPAPDGSWQYYTRFETGQQYPLICRKPRDAGDDMSSEQVMLDGNREAEGKPYWRLGATAHSPDHRYLAYAVDENGSEYFTIRIRDLESGADLPDAIPDTSASLTWAADSQTLFFVRVDDNHRPLFVHRHTLGAEPTAAPRVYEEGDSGFFVGVGRTHSGAFVVINVHRHETSELYVIDADTPTSAPRLIAARREGHEYDLEHQGDRFLILTNSNDAVDFRVCETPVSSPDESNWREIVPHKSGRLILSQVAFKHHVVRLERENGLPRIIITATDSGEDHAIAFSEEAYGLGMSAGFEFDTKTVRFTYSSMTTPAQVFDYDMSTRERTLRKTQEVPSGHAPFDYVTRRIYARARDGETVPISLLYHRNTVIDGSAPVLLYGYGSYGISIPAGFSTARLSLVDRGFVYAIAHIRGGKEKGYGWYLDGKREKKTNTFNDFVDAGAYLVEQGFTQRGRIVAMGGSAGGLLMGAVANQAPDLFLGIIANVPFVDTLNTMLDKDLPLTPPEWPEWGNPIESRTDYDLIKSYSPYDNVLPQAYPHIFAEGGLTDPRVTYWEPAKWIAKLRDQSTGSNLLLLRTNMEAGHGGASGRFESLREAAREFAFALKISGKT